MTSIRLSDGYNGDFVECESEPIEKDGDTYKLRVKDSYLIKWCSRQQWENAMYEAYEKEAYENENFEEEYKQDERRQRFQEWLKEES